MGAWGAGIFESDGALDFLTELQRLPDPRDRMRQACEAATGASYLEVDEGGAVLVSAAIIKAAILKEPLTPRQTAEWTLWQEKIGRLDRSALKVPAVRACRRVLADGSELRELWLENANMFQQWKGNVDAIIFALER